MNLIKALFISCLWLSALTGCAEETANPPAKKAATEQAGDAVMQCPHCKMTLRISADKAMTDAMSVKCPMCGVEMKRLDKASKATGKQSLATMECEHCNVTMNLKGRKAMMNAVAMKCPMCGMDMKKTMIDPEKSKKQMGESKTDAEKMRR